MAFEKALGLRLYGVINSQRESNGQEIRLAFGSSWNPAECKKRAEIRDSLISMQSCGRDRVFDLCESDRCENSHNLPALSTRGTRSDVLRVGVQLVLTEGVSCDHAMLITDVVGL